MNWFRLSPRRGLALAALLLLVGPLRAQTPDLTRALFPALEARPLGPANMSGRVTDLAVVPGKPAILYVAAASGGLWKSTNNGGTWTPVFDKQPVQSIGAVAVAPSRPDTIWVGTGEANARNSVSWGDGVYRSLDAGKTWKHMGLRDTHHIGRIVVHPKDPDTVFVAALGHLWGPNKERGLFRTRDGGDSWDPVLAPDEDTGAIDVVFDPTESNVLYAAAYKVRRGPFSGGDPAAQFGAAAGMYRSTDGGATWQRMTNGLPDRPMGRCGLAVCPSAPGLVYAVVQTDKTAIRTFMMGQASGNTGKVEEGGVFRSLDRGSTWEKVNDLCPRPFYFGQVRLDPRDPQRVWVLGIFLHVSDDGGKEFRTDGAPAVHGDFHALWVDPADSDHLILGCDGGVYFSYDRGKTWEHVNNLPIGQFYAIGLDSRKPYRVYGGLQDNGTWGGPSRTHRPEGIINADWFRVFGADGYYAQPDPTDPDTVYCEGQYGMLRRVDVRTGEETNIRPSPATLAPAYRFNWCSPICLSPHNNQTIYYGGNHVFKSVNRGNRWDTISPDLTHGKPGASKDDGHTLTALAESPLRPGLLWAGSDDGRIHLSRDGGAKWTDLSAKVPGVPPERWITRFEPSPFAEGTAFLSLDRHRQDDRAPYLFRTDDFGATWKPLMKGLPPGGPVHVVRADARNRDLLYVGTEFGLFASTDAGQHWQPFTAGLPPVAVHDLALHHRDRELVVGTHGRSLYVLDVAPLQELTAAVWSAPAHLFAVKPGRAFLQHGGREPIKGRNFLAPNPPYGVAIYYLLKEKQEGKAIVGIHDAEGNEVAVVEGPGEPGIVHRVTWNLASPRGLLKGAWSVPAGDYVARLKGFSAVAPRQVRVEMEE